MEQSVLLALPMMARRLRVSQHWLRSEADAGRIPHIRAGGTRYLFSPAAVEAILADRAAREGVVNGGAAR